ncbi:protein kinase [Achlya hypogyna]|uniref:Protein kinase n=1 Tax=Achlya hypogyna TaxID=1202772 RepID=A0A1V9ZUC7_ACHHY|nr:protein kinase [Achlya hypogyna]
MPSSSTLTSSCVATCGDGFGGVCALYMGAADCPESSSVPCMQATRATYYQCFNVTEPSFTLLVGSSSSGQTKLPLANVATLGTVDLRSLSSLSFQGQGDTMPALATTSSFLALSTTLTSLSFANVALSPLSQQQLPASLQSLSMVKCNLTEWPIADGLASLVSLDISRNGLKSIPAAVVALPKLKSLNASGNPLALTGLQTAPMAAFFTRLKTFHVDVAMCGGAALTFTSPTALAAAKCSPGNATSDSSTSTADRSTTAPGAAPSLMSPTVIALVAVAGVLAIVGVFVVLRRRRTHPAAAPVDGNSPDLPSYRDAPKTKDSGTSSSLHPGLVSALKKPKDAAAMAFAAKYTGDTELQALVLPATAVVPTRRLARSQNRSYDVWLGQYEDQFVAIKRVAAHVADADACAERLVEELRSLSRLHHPNIVRLRGLLSLAAPDAVGGVMDHCVHGDLQALLAASAVDDPTWSWPSRKFKLALGVARALAYLHGQAPSVIHRDVRCKSVLVDERFEAQLSNFESARARSILDTMTQDVGTMQWIAPEVLRGEDYCEAVDVYSFGVVLTELATHQVPFHDYHHEDTKRVLVQELMTGRAVPSFGDDCPAPVLALGRQCLQLDPSKRPPMASVVDVLEKLLHEHDRDGFLV